MIERTIDLFFKLLEAVLVALLAGMTVMVFANVILRYVFSSGLDISEELSRFFFVWLIFIGAIVAMRHHAHMGFDLLVTASSPGIRRVLLFISNGLILFVCWLLLNGAWLQSGVTATDRSPVTGLSMIFVFGIVIPSAIGIGIIAIHRMIGAVRGSYDPYAAARSPEAMAEHAV
ncbi:TRAP transporter small permease [Mesorhizobium microcysteis]|jgi:TRAP-type C4-dicarboxylate transport system permease small subunit|uniref:TRAP transporter small permease protein n=1 Tax=Neoaquamicrobium microcysteis TaxID=2682781 RepID=A0A5D4GZD0_9HYPH|nr:TRAP transporter small permease [Mesorhizobium microcysteis]TYR33986.1 TRAP transporter small permease [Mesorhizobium microcysteis]